MGLMDTNGMQNGPRGQSQPALPAGPNSLIMTAMLALLAYKAFKGGGLETCLAVSRVCKIRTDTKRQVQGLVDSLAACSADSRQALPVADSGACLAVCWAVARPVAC